MSETISPPTIRRAVFTGIISGTCVLVFIRPLIALVWKFVLSNVEYVTDGVCRSAALGYTERFGFLTLSTFLSLMVGLAMGLAFVGRAKPNAMQYKVGLAIFRATRVRWFINVFAVVFVLFSGYLLTTNFMVLQMNASFHQRLAVLSPRITDEKYKEFVAAWASMRSERDYAGIVDNMDQTAKSNGVVLPELLGGAAPSR